MRSVKLDQARLLGTKGITAAAGTVGKPTIKTLDGGKLLSTKGLTAAALKPIQILDETKLVSTCLLYTSPSPRD